MVVKQADDELLQLTDVVFQISEIDVMASIRIRIFLSSVCGGIWYSGVPSFSVK